VRISGTCTAQQPTKLPPATYISFRNRWLSKPTHGLLKRSHPCIHLVCRRGKLEPWLLKKEVERRTAPARRLMKMQAAARKPSRKPGRDFWADELRRPDYMQPADESG
jgi:hypothetical protein